jgi:RNA polymerase sigma-70 factor (ECF subfamily)
MSAESASERLARLSPPSLLRDRREASLVRDAQRGSEEALEELFRRHWRRAHRAAYLVVGDPSAAEDIAQESFLAAIRALDRFDRRRPFGPWLHRITVNRAIDWTRARALRRETAMPAGTEGEQASSERESAPPASPSERLSESLLAALASLEPEQRAVVVLRHLLGYTPGEIGEMLGLPRGTVNSRMRRALDRLRPAIEREDREEP